jgi:DNA modification methylase
VSAKQTPIVRRLYESSRATLFVGDCRDALDLIPARSCGLLATDPPYGVNWQSSFRADPHRRIAGDDGSLDVPAILASYTAKLAVTRHVYVFGYRPDDLAGPLRLGGTAELIWDKGQPGLGDLTMPWGPQHEPIAFGMFVPSAANRRNGYGKLSARMRQGSVLRVPRKNSAAANRHPTEKPVALMAMIVEASSLRGDVVLDPFAGTGATLVAALLLGRRAIGIELDERWADEAARRLEAAERIADAVDAA